MASNTRKVTDGPSHAVCYCEKWESEFTWLVPERNEVGVVVGMFCRLCTRHKCTGKYNHSSVWNEVPCVSLCNMGCQMRQKAMRHNSIIYLPLLFIYQTPISISDSYLYISDSYLYIRLLFIYIRLLFVYQTPIYM